MGHRFASVLSCLVIPLTLVGQGWIGTGAVHELYVEHCLQCHGENLEGETASSLVDDVWMYGGTDADIARVIREGLPDEGMIAYDSVLNDEQIRALVVYIREKAQLALQAETPQHRVKDDEPIQTRHHAFRLEKVLGIEEGIFWSVGFLPDETMLLAHFDGRLYLARDGNLGDPVKKLPTVHRRGQGGLLEAQAHPDYAENGWIYLGYSDAAVNPETGREGHTTRIVRGKVRDGEWVDGEDIFVLPPRFYTGSGVHFGTRFVFENGYLYFSIGDRGQQDQAQDLSLPNGKIHRIHDDGRIPGDNPFVGRTGAMPSIWTYGNRNPQGLDLHPATGQLWSTEHGPRGGDELNIIEKGNNYGWPVITHGINYNGLPITDITHAPGMEQPIHHWTPSIAVCGIDFYEGNAFPGWKHDLLVTGLRSEHLERFKLNGETVTEHEIILRDRGRVRDVSTGPDGLIYLILNEGRGGPSGIYRMVASD